MEIFLLRGEVGMLGILKVIWEVILKVIRYAVTVYHLYALFT